MADSSITDSVIVATLSVSDTFPVLRDTIWVGVQDRLDVLVTAAAALGGTLFGFAGTYWLTIKEWKRRDDEQKADVARSWSAAIEQVRICLDRMHGLSRATAGRSELYWVQDIALAFYRSCPHVRSVHRFRHIDEIVHQFNYNLAKPDPNPAYGYAAEYYEDLKKNLDELRDDLSRFVANNKIKDIRIPETVPPTLAAAPKVTQ